MTTQLYEIDPAKIKVNQPLQWDVFSVQGKLLLQKGSIILTEDQRERLLEFGMYVNKADVQKRVSEGARQAFDPFYEWDDLRGWLGRLNLALMKVVNAPVPGPMPNLLAEIDQVAKRIQMAVTKAPDESIFQIMQMETTHYVIAHHLQAAALCAIVARSIGWSEHGVLNACRAALTMNIGMLDLQSTLTSQTTPLTPAQRKIIDEHGAVGRRLLEAIGVVDQEWLCAVEKHHPEREAPGAPIPLLAQLAHHVDIYLAKVTPRAYRSAKNAQVAARELLQDPRLDKGLTSPLIKMIGIYPPGTYVKLANGDSAVVVRRGANAHTPSVCSLVSATGLPLGEPVARDTSQPKYAITSLLSGTKVMVVFDRIKLFRLTSTGNLAPRLAPHADQAGSEREASV
ncbi:HD-GYP domain-containing protein [Massilia horti]|uniref:Phosphohydrolase n=1 Tax=Massilia horti TaxID=2562153 RepID=A0A4Y9SYM4_9BURK|nr:HD domain-containing phosphohydrolase [Massilia horti]TFW31852.1 hypothetical protein E4O92_12045 [Massilia horti]